MAQYVIQGRQAALDVSRDGGISWFRVKGVMSYTVNRGTDDQETSDMDDDGEKQFQPGLDEITLDIEANFMDQDQGQRILSQSGDDSEKILFDWAPNAEVGEPSFRGQGYVNQEASTAANPDPSKINFTLRGSCRIRDSEYAQKPGPSGGGTQFLAGAYLELLSLDINGNGDSNAGFVDADPVGSVASPWVNRGSLGGDFRQPSGGLQPQINIPGVGPHPSVEWDQSSVDHIPDNPADWTFLSDGSPFTIVVAHRFVEVFALDQILLATSELTSGEIGFTVNWDHVNERLRIRTGDGVGDPYNFFTPNGSHPDGAMVLFAIRLTPGAAGDDVEYIDVNSVVLASAEPGAFPPGAPADNLHIGGTDLNLLLADGESLFYSIHQSALSDSDLAQQFQAVKDNFPGVVFL